MVPPLVIFDCDGVLVDSERIASSVLCSQLAEVGLILDPSETDRRFRGRSLADCLSLIEADLPRPLPQDFVQHLNERTYAAFRASLQAVDGVHEAIEALVEKGVKVCVASSGSHEKMLLTLGLTGLLPFFEGRCFSASDVVHGKPAPDLFLYAAAQMNEDPSTSVVIEDSLTGATGAHRAGARVLAYVPTHQAAEATSRAFRELGAEVFERMDELAPLLFQ